MSAARKVGERPASSPVLAPVASAADRTLGLFGEVALERAARRVGADPREALLVGVRELRKVAAGGAS